MVQKESDLEKSLQLIQSTILPKNQPKITTKVANRIIINETDDDEEAVSSLMKLNDKKATKNVLGVVTGLNTNSTPGKYYY